MRDLVLEAVPGRIVTAGDGLKWVLDAEGMDFAERMQVAVTARHSLQDLIPHEVGRIRDCEETVEMNIEADEI